MERERTIGCRAVATAYRLLGGLWLAAWAALLYVFHEPWRHLGGLVGERLRWLETFTLAVGLVGGFNLAGHVRELGAPTNGRAYARIMRRLLYPAMVLTAIGLVGLTRFRLGDPAGVVSVGFLAYWAGVDLAMGVLPLLRGDPPAGSPPE